MARGGRHQAERGDSDNRFRHRFGQSDMLQTYVMFFVMLSMCRSPSCFIRPKSRYKFQIFFTGISDCQAHACLVLDRIQGTSLRYYFPGTIVHQSSVGCFSGWRGCWRHLFPRRKHAPIIRRLLQLVAGLLISLVLMCGFWLLPAQPPSPASAQ